MTVSGGFQLREVDYSDLRGWGSDDPRPLFSVMRECLEYLDQGKAYRAGTLGLTADDLRPLLADAASTQSADPAAARLFFEQRCIPFRIELGDQGAGFVTAFYEPEVEVSDKLESGYRYPFYRRPPDLVDLDESSRPPDLDASYAFGRLDDGAIEAYPDRQAIDQGCLEGRGLEIAWAKSKVDVFFAHVQGAARLHYPDGRLGRITYAAKAGHPFSPIGKLLIDRGEIEREQISMQSIRRWLAENPAKVDEVLWHNRSYIFFREAEVTDLDRGPIAAAKVPLLAGRSLAVDRSIHTFGFPFFIHSQTLSHLSDGQPFSRLMLALDTGTAIVGPARGDIFTGSGDEAGDLAGTVRNDADFYILIPIAAAQRFR
ncbi:murein transglycosylase A [Rhizobium sp. SAFR-030]|uniref:murein transglycosylase A n=1 Tax=Rhizobium sp. SAFR-030 TaxID=3387277 RepID=UPI003F803D8E